MSEPVHYDYELERLVGEQLEPIRTEFGERSRTVSPAPVSPVLADDQVDPGLNVLFSSNSHGHQELRLARRRDVRSFPSAPIPAMTEQAKESRPSSEAIPARPAPKTELSTDSDGTTATIDSAIDLRSEQSLKAVNGGEQQEQAAVALATRPRATKPGATDVSDASREPASRSGLGSPLRIETPAPAETRTAAQDGDSIARSPILSKYTRSGAEDKGETLPPFEPTSPTTSSPQAERLPSIRQLAGSLTDLAEAATAATHEIARQQQSYTHHRSHSFGSATSHSPVMANHPYPASMQTSPQAYYPPSASARSPTSTIAETAPYGSPAGFPSYGFFAHRRPSTIAEGPPPMPSLPSASSSGESHGYGPSPGMESYSTQHTTPIDVSQGPDGTPRIPPAQMLPVPMGMQPPPPIMIPGPYKCDVQGCMAGTFQTQYLLKSVDDRIVHEL